MGFFAHWRALRAFNALPPTQRQLVFYAEDKASWTHLGPVVDHLVDHLGEAVCYLTSEKDDPVLEDSRPHLRSFAVGEGVIRTWLFAGLRCAVAVMTMPDLDCFHLKRSQAQEITYAYIFHSMVSSHMIYREKAFDNYDLLFAVGPHHTQEIRAAESRRGLRGRRIVEHGYGRLDTLLREASAAPRPRQEGPTSILIAPSWGPHGLLELHGEEIVKILLQAGYEVTVRPHPMTPRKSPQIIHDLRTFENHPRFVLETDVRNTESLHTAHLMISDYSGAALEFALGLGRPVLFVDVPKKVNNPRWRDLDSPPLEVSIRAELGAILPADSLENAPSIIERLLAEGPFHPNRHQALRERWIYNLGYSAETAAKALSNIIHDKPASLTEI